MNPFLVPGIALVFLVAAAVIWPRKPQPKPIQLGDRVIWPRKPQPKPIQLGDRVSWPGFYTGKRLHGWVIVIDGDTLGVRQDGVGPVTVNRNIITKEESS